MSIGNQSFSSYIDVANFDQYDMYDNLINQHAEIPPQWVPRHGTGQDRRSGRYQMGERT